MTCYIVSQCYDSIAIIFSVIIDFNDRYSLNIQSFDKVLSAFFL